jgi:hypothetical protein
MKAIISTTYDDQYLFYHPITTWAWNKLGIDVICFMPYWHPGDYPDNLLLAETYTMKMKMRIIEVGFKAPNHKAPTYAQCSRLYAAALPDIDDNELLVTSDVDMATFMPTPFLGANDDAITIIGADLVPEKQFPMCYIIMSAKNWREVMWIRKGESVQNKLDQELGHIECEHFRGNLWARDQELAYNHIVASGLPIVKVNRAAPGTQFATRRADRDGWPQIIPPDIIDAHLSRPGYKEENFAKILNLFQTMYPNDDFTWMVEYRNEYVKLINP